MVWPLGNAYHTRDEPAWFVDVYPIEARPTDLMDQMLQTIDQDILGRMLWGATAQEWLLALLIGVTVSAGLIALHRLVTWRFKRFAERTANIVDDILSVVLEKTRLYFLIAVGLYLGIVLRAIPREATLLLGKVVLVLVLLQVIRWGSSVITFYVSRYKERMLETDPGAVTTMQAVGFIGRMLLWIVVGLLALQNFGIEVTALVASLGIGGIAVALAVQNILGDLFASLSIVLDKPFVVGDFLIVDNYMGTVENVGLKTTRIRSLSGEQIVFSNSDLLNSRLRNYKRMYERRVVFGIGVVYQTPARQLARIPGMIREIVEAQEQTRFDRAHFKAFGDFALTFEVVYYVLSPDYTLYMDIQQAINLALYQRFEAEGIVFAYPTQTLYLTAEQALPVQTQPANGQAGTPEA